jgi:hypothetical protein
MEVFFMKKLLFGFLVVCELYVSGLAGMHVEEEKVERPIKVVRKPRFFTFSEEHIRKSDPTSKVLPENNEGHIIIIRQPRGSVERKVAMKPHRVHDITVSELEDLPLN